MSNTTIDLVLTNYDDVIVDILSDEQISDHRILKLENLNSKFTEYQEVVIKNYSNYSKRKIQNELMQVNWIEVSNLDINSKIDVLINSIKGAVLKLVSEKVIKIKNKNELFDKELKREKDLIKNFLQRAHFTKEEEDWLA